MRTDEIGGFNDSFERYKDRITNFSNEFEFGLFMHILKQALPVVIVILALCFTTSYLYLRYTVPIYQASSILQLENKDKAKMVLNVDNFAGTDDLSTDIELLRSDFILVKSINRLKIPVRYFEEGKIRSNEHYKVSPYEVKIVAITDSSIAFDRAHYIDFLPDGKFNLTNARQTSGPHSTAEEVVILGAKIVVLLNLDNDNRDLVDGNPRYFKLTSVRSLVREFSRQMSIAVLNPTAKTVQISYQNPNARLSRDLVRAHTQTYFDFNQGQKEKSSLKILDFIDSQLDTVAENLRNAEFLLNSFKQEHRLSNINNISDIYLQRLNDVSQRVFQLELEGQKLDLLESVQDSTIVDMDIYELIAILTGTRFESSLESMLDKLATLLRQKEELYFEVTPSSEVIRSINYRVGIQKDLIVKSIGSLKAQNEAEIKALTGRSNELESEFSGLPAQELEYARYQRLYSINEGYYTSLLQRKIEYRLSKAGSVSDFKVLKQAEVPTSPISPKNSMVYGGFMALGVILSLLFVVVRYLLHNNITSLNEIAKLSEASISVLGMVPKFKEKIPVSQLIIDKKPKSLIAESFRSIRTNLEFLGDVRGPKVIAVTSTISSEGKTFVALNLAGIISLSGKRVVILDLDMRRPKIHKGFSVDNDKGMSTILINKHNFDDCVRHSQLNGLDYVTAGPVAPNPSELMISPRMTEVIEEAKSKYDIVMIDNPPVGLVTDGIASIKIADYPIYIFRADYSKKHFVQNVDRLINETGIRKMSVILNDVDVERNKYGSFYGYGYGYGYGYAYGSQTNNGYYDTEGPAKSWFGRLKQKLWK